MRVKAESDKSGVFWLLSYKKGANRLFFSVFNHKKWAVKQWVMSNGVMFLPIGKTDYI